jgi:hypothetical protein
VVGDVIEKVIISHPTERLKEIISIPNSTVMSSPLSITAVHLRKGYYSTHNHWLRSWKEMHQALIDAASQTALILQNQNLLYKPA